MGGRSVFRPIMIREGAFKPFLVDFNRFAGNSHEIEVYIPSKTQGSGNKTMTCHDTLHCSILSTKRIHTPPCNSEGDTRHSHRFQK